MAYYIAYKANIENKKFNQMLLNSSNNLYNKEHLHCTLYYTDADFNKDAQNIIALDCEVKVTDVVMWVDKGQKFIVLKLQKELLTHINKQIIAKLGLLGVTDREYNPHVTIKKGLECESVEEFKFMIGQTVRLSNLFVKIKENEKN